MACISNIAFVARLLFSRVSMSFRELQVQEEQFYFSIGGVVLDGEVARLVRVQNTRPDFRILEADLDVGRARVEQLLRVEPQIHLILIA